MRLTVELMTTQLFLGDDNSGVTLALRRSGAVKNVHLLRGKTIENRALKEGEVCGIGISMAVVE